MVRAGLSFGDARKLSADVVTVPLFRLPDTGRDLFGVVSMHSYTAGIYDDEAVSAFEWLATVLTRTLNRDREDHRTVGLLTDDEVQGHTPVDLERVVEHVVMRLDHLRSKADAARELADAEAGSVENWATWGTSAGVCRPN